MIIDSHQHAFWHNRSDRDLVADMDAQGIDLAWLLTWLISPEEEPARADRYLNPARRGGDGSHRGIVMEDLLVARDHYPDRFLVGYCPHPRMGDPAAAFEAACHMHGVQVCGEWKYRMLLDDPRCLELFGKAGELGCPVVLHLDVPYRLDEKTGRLAFRPDWYGGTVANLERALQACPGTNFIGHAPGFWREISGDAEGDPAAYSKSPVAPGGKLHGLFQRYPNLYADLSAGSGLNALKRDLAHGREFAVRFSDRLLFGRDYFGGQLQEFLASLDLPAEVRDRIFFGNAQRLIHPRSALEFKPL